jgi:membrane protease subunit (stomatin/prohibitin family)
VPQNSLRPDRPIFDFADMATPAGTRLFDAVVSSLSSAFSIYVRDPNKSNRITQIQSDQVGFANSLAQAVEKDYDWQNLHGLKIVKAAIVAIEYDEDTKKLLSDVRRADALGGARGASFAQQAFARGMQAAGENGGAAGMAFMGMNMQAAGGMMGAFGQSQNATAAQTEDPYEKLRKMKQLLDDGVISQDDFDNAKKKLLGL